MRRINQIRDLDNREASALSGAAIETIEYQSPATGFNLTIGNTTNVFQLEPAGTLAAGTVAMPAKPFDNQIVRIASTQVITALTHNANAGQTLKGALTTIAANGFASYAFRAANNTWYRIG